MLYLITLCLIGGIISIVLGMRQAQREAPETAVARLTRMRERREDLTEDAIVRREREKQFAKQEEQRAARRKTTFLPSLSRLFMSHAILMRLENDLAQVRSPWRASELLTASLLFALVVFILLAYLGSPLLALPIAIACLFLPWSYVKVLRARYYRKFDEQLADTLMLMANSLKAGFSFLQSVEIVSREAQPPISDEFGRLTQEIALGVPISQAMESLSDRINSMDLSLMVTAVLIQREVGGSLAEILETIASVIRERVRIRGEIRTLTTQGRMTGMLLGILPISLGLILHFVTTMMAPDQESFVMPLINTAVGQTMLVIAGVMQVIGFTWIMKIVSIKV
jgi:tight adherence protein B